MPLVGTVTSKYLHRLYLPVSIPYTHACTHASCMTTESTSFVFLNVNSFSHRLKKTKGLQKTKLLLPVLALDKRYWYVQLKQDGELLGFSFHNIVSRVNKVF